MLVIEILRGLIYQDPVLVEVYIGSCRISAINSIASRCYLETQALGVERPGSRQFGSPNRFPLIKDRKLFLLLRHGRGWIVHDDYSEVMWGLAQGITVNAKCTS